MGPSLTTALRVGGALARRATLVFIVAVLLTPTPAAGIAGPSGGGGRGGAGGGGGGGYRGGGYRGGGGVPSRLPGSPSYPHSDGDEALPPGSRPFDGPFDRFLDGPGPMIVFGSLSGLIVLVALVVRRRSNRRSPPGPRAGRD